MVGLGKKGKVSAVRDCSWVPGKFENLAVAGFDVVRDCTSDRTAGLPANYNCIAWAAGKDSEWWWPLDVAGYYWPKGLPKESLSLETLENFINAFKTESYTECQTSDHEEGFEKVAIFTNQQGRPTHAARSLPNGAWTSKLGGGEDIQHPTLESIEGRTYGKAATFLKRRIQYT
jgi:hypothetical protein